MADHETLLASDYTLRPCGEHECPCPNYNCRVHGTDCECQHGPDKHGGPTPPKPISTSVLKPVKVKNTGDKTLVFVADNPKETFKLPPGKTHPLSPGNYRVQVDFTKPPIVIVIAKIIYDHKLKTFDIKALDGLKGASFETTVDLVAFGPIPH